MRDQLVRKNARKSGEDETALEQRTEAVLARNVQFRALDYLRRDRRYVELTQELVDSGVAGVVVPEDAPADEPGMPVVSRLIDRLPPRCREAYLLVHDQGYTYKEAVAALFFSAAILGFLVRGGTQVVRAILNKAGSLPTVQTEVDEVEYNRGRLIGSIERLLLAGVVAAGSYGALGFLVAAKGLIRSRDLERRDFAEYFLIGTLTSTAIAMVAGGLLRLVFAKLW